MYNRDIICFLRIYKMFDKLELRIDFLSDYVTIHRVSTDESRSGMVNFRDYDFPTRADTEYQNGVPIIIAESAQKFDTIQSSLSGMAVAFFPEGCGFYHWPHVLLKCSPSKILQGHNVFGTESIEQGALQMLSMLSIRFPKIYSHLSIATAEIRNLDCTYSCRIRPFFSKKIFYVFSLLANKNVGVNRNYIDEGYVLIGQNSDVLRLKLYTKFDELNVDLKKAKKAGESDRIKILSDQRLQDFAVDLHRFEASIFSQKLRDLGIPTNLYEFVKFQKWFLSVHKQTLCSYLWQVGFKKIFSQLRGHTMTNVDDDSVRKTIREKHYKFLKSGRISYSFADKIFDTYEKIKNNGYQTYCSGDYKAKFHRHVRLMEEAGISKAFLKSLTKDSNDSLVVPIVNLIQIDFSQQRPDWYVEPLAGFSDQRRHLSLVA